MANAMEASDQEAEDLALLVRDNLPAKHLVLSVEELFVEFLEFQPSEEETLALEPMAPYQRMLVHRLADLFGLAHESFGEGDDRHLVVGKCEESSIPRILVSDVLHNNDGEASNSIQPRHLLQRNMLTSGAFHSSSSSKITTVPLEERQAAYFAARQRIFSGTLKHSQQNSHAAGSVRPKSDPVVARRMIAHALGEPKLRTFTNTSGIIPAQGLDVQSTASSVLEKNSSVNSKKRSEDLKESMQQSSVNAAKRMFANALGLPPADLSQRVSPQRPPFRKATGNCSESNEPEEETCEESTSKIENGTAGTETGGETDCEGCLRESGEKSSRPVVIESRHPRPGSAACRILARALGLPDPVSSRARGLSPSKTVPLAGI